MKTAYVVQCLDMTVNAIDCAVALKMHLLVTPSIRSQRFTGRHPRQGKHPG